MTPSNSVISNLGTLQMAANAQDSAGDTVLVATGNITWMSLDTSIATIDATSGLLTGRTAGSVSIVATECESGVSGHTTVTVMAIHLGPDPIVLGSAGSFAILAGSTVTNTGSTIINGNLGVSPGSAVVGFSGGPGIVNGTLYTASDPTVTAAKHDLSTAYTDAAGRRLNVVTIPSGELGGLILPPGLYQSSISSFAITSLDLTLDAQGDPTAVWIFQMPSSTLTVGNGRQVILTGGAQAGNITWQVGSSATLGTTSNFAGNILAQAAITLQTGALLNGRALALVAAVTLDANSVTVPAGSPSQSKMR